MENVKKTFTEAALQLLLNEDGVSFRDLKQLLRDAIKDAGALLPDVPVLHGRRNFETTEEFDAFYAEREPEHPRVSDWTTPEEEMADKRYREKAARLMPEFGRAMIAKYPLVYAIVYVTQDPKIAAMMDELYHFCRRGVVLAMKIERLPARLAEVTRIIRVGVLNDCVDEYNERGWPLMFNVADDPSNIHQNLWKLLTAPYLGLSTLEDFQAIVRGMTQTEAVKFIESFDVNDAIKLLDQRLADHWSGKSWPTGVDALREDIFREFLEDAKRIEAGQRLPEEEDDGRVPFIKHLETDPDLTSDNLWGCLLQCVGPLNTIHARRVTQLISKQGAEAAMKLCSHTTEAKIQAETLVGLMFAGGYNASLSITRVPAVDDYILEDTHGFEKVVIQNGLHAERKTKFKRWSSDSGHS